MFKRGLSYVMGWAFWLSVMAGPVALIWWLERLAYPTF